MSVPASKIKETQGRGMPRLLQSVVQNKNMVAGVVRTRHPTATLAPAKFGAGKFLRFRVQKQIFQETEIKLELKYLKQYGLKSIPSFSRSNIRVVVIKRREYFIEERNIFALSLHCYVL